MHLRHQEKNACHQNEDCRLERIIIVYQQNLEDSMPLSIPTVVSESEDIVIAADHPTSIFEKTFVSS